MPLQEDVLWLEVHVGDVLRTQELQGESQLLQESTAYRFRKNSVGPDVSGEVAVAAVFWNPSEDTGPCYKLAALQKATTILKGFDWLP